ncbi:MAG: sigma-70 family RNA polymerase sigma factor [Planctomycetes bacterium]|nr:sigma-70 family RNA polymerase sigma factor [Planctomycetota bacterium]
MHASMRPTTPAPPVEASLARFRETGDPTALGDVFDQAAPELFRLALAWTPDAASAEDALQETFLALFDAVRAWDPSRPAMPWLAGVLRHKAEKVRLRVRREPDPLRVAPPLGAPDPASEAERHDDLERARGAIAALPEPYRAVAIMRWRYGLEPAEIAEIRGEPPGTVRSTLTRALRRLRDDLGGPAAVFAWFGRAGEPRGLSGVRDAVVREAARHAAATGSATVGTTTILGVLIMKKAVVAAIALMLLVGAAVIVNDLAAPTVPHPAIVPSPTIDHAPPARARPEPPPEPPAADTLPASIDLNAIDRDRDLHGVVVRRDDSPVAGAAIVAVTYQWRRASRVNHAEYRTAVQGPATQSARDGTFALRLERGQCVALRVSAPGLAPVELATRQAGERVRVVLTEGVAARVTVTDAANVPLAGVAVELSDDGRFTATTYRRGATDASGVAVFDGLPPSERVLVRCIAAGRVSSGVRAMDLPPTGEATLVVVLATGRTLRGRVIDAETGAPVAAASVGFGWDGERAAATSEDGAYTLTGLTEKGDELVTVRATGYAVAREAPGTRDVVDFSLRPAFGATGRIVGADGAPVAGALVAAVASPSENGGTSCLSAGFATSGADGHFRIADLDRTLRHVLTVTASRSGRLSVVVPAPEPRADADLGDVVLPAARAIEGRVLDAASRPLAQVRVTASGPLGRDSGPPLWRTDERLTDDLGRFRFGDLAPGRYQLTASPENPPRIELSVDVPEESDALGVVLAQSGARTLTVRVIDDAGAPVPRALVNGSGRYGAEFARAATGADGTARIAVGANAVFVNANPPYGSQRAFLPCEAQPLRPDTTEVTLVLREGSSLAGKVLDPDGKPVARAFVRIREGSSRELTASTGEDGRFRATVPQGAVCSVSFDGIVGNRDTDLTARADNATPGVEVVLTCERVATGRTVRVRVTDPAGEPVAGVTVWLSGDYRETVRRADTDADGRAQFADLPAHKWRLTAGSHGVWYQAAPVEAVPNGQEVTLVLRTAATIRGVISGKNGRGVRAVAAARSDTDERFFVSDLSDDDGLFTLRVSMDDPGPFRVTARFTDSAPGVEDAAVDGVSPGANDVRLVLPK